MNPLVAVLAGGFLGTALRFGIDSAAPGVWATLAINIGGSFALGYLVARVWPGASPWLRAGLGTGLLGSFTTFSAVAVAAVTLASNDEWMPALAYLAFSLLGGLLAAWLGLRAGANGSGDRAIRHTGSAAQETGGVA